MIEDFLRRPRGAAEYAADAVRVLGVVGVVIAAVGWSATDAGIIALSLPAIMAPRFVGARAGFDLAASITVLVAAWSNVLGLYRAVTGWDLVVHLVCTGVLAALVLVFFARFGLLPTRVGARRVPIVVTTTIGFALSAVWEIIEWLGETFVTDEIYVTYDDTIGDMIAGGLGGLIAGIVLSRVSATRDDTPRAPAQGRAVSGDPAV